MVQNEPTDRQTVALIMIDTLPRGAGGLALTELVPSSAYTFIISIIIII